MEKHYFTGRHRNYYHTIAEKETRKEDEKSIHITGVAEITFFSLEKIKKGSILIISKREYVITEIVENRNHAGIFKNPEDKKKSFWSVKCEYEFIINKNVDKRK